MSVLLTTNLSDPSAVPYFLWDDPMTVAELRERLATVGHVERMRILGRIMREARDPDVWLFTTVSEVVANWRELAPHLGRRRPFWEWLLAQWGETPAADA